ncbi:hypothetical protein [Sediminispirochaeta smaragdinae]|uniref:Uncharacterized protein n=1 Tax=Sediminispirochaeta smaragdinae (strain DSM 11293 / JCM 15392 / SEBR 4228) TaxID=573413 RepID=E1R1I4_SEDSS|nr:hypothetical protein [Sediminispirochaeta smaragdinae]ADK81125.1 hypothetical protein Spirs_2003 [Sediminispirochaeta smaragdinae DSM 11293]
MRKIISIILTLFVCFSAGFLLGTYRSGGGDSGRAAEYDSRGKKRDTEYQALSDEYERAVEAYEGELAELRKEVAGYQREAGGLTERIGGAQNESVGIAERAGRAEDGLSRALDLLRRLREAEPAAGNGP